MRRFSRVQGSSEDLGVGWGTACLEKAHAETENAKYKLKEVHLMGRVGGAHPAAQGSDQYNGIAGTHSEG